jgi:hypothetical protein
MALIALTCTDSLPSEGLYVQGGLMMGAGELSLGAEAGFASAGAFAVIPAALSAAYDWPLSGSLSLGAGLRAELKQPGRAAGLYMSAGLDVSPEKAGAALLPVFEIGLRLRPMKN